MENQEFIDGLKVKYPYQFARQSLGFHVPEGWQPIFAELCEDIDAVLDENEKPHFHWVQLKEKFGTARFYAEFHKPDDAPPSMLDGNGLTERFGRLFSLRPIPSNEAIRTLIMAAEATTAKVCLKCGESGTLRRGGWVRTLCDKHEAEYQARLKADLEADGEDPTLH
jgi:hypothetical protein